MPIVRYDPFRDLRSLQEEVNRLFSTNLTRGFAEEGIGRGAWNPSVDIYENKEHIVLEAELPGMNRERQFEKKDETDNYHRVERSYGSFTRAFTLPQTVSADGATAEYRNGVLRVTLPKREETKARRIQISGEEKASSTKTIEAKPENVPTEKSRTAIGNS